MINLVDYCCSGITRTSDFINYLPLSAEAGMPYLNGGQLPVLGLLELNNGDILFMAYHPNLSLFKYDYVTKSVSKLNWQDIMKNSILIRKSGKNSNFPREWYENILVEYNNNRINPDYSLFQSMNVTENGTTFLTFSDFV